MPRAADYFQTKAIILAMAAACMAGCSSDPDPPPDLSADEASAQVVQKWSHDVSSHFKVTFHSESLIGCGVQNGLWKLVETPHDGFTVSTYQLTEAGRKALFAIDLKESGRYHEIILEGPYAVEVTGMAPGSTPDTRQVAIRWDIDWNKAPAGIKACLPRFELTGKQVALFKLSDQGWRIVSLETPADGNAPTQARAGPA